MNFKKSDRRLPFEKREYEVIVKREEETNPNFGFFPEERPVSYLLDYGYVNLDKPSGPTSHVVSDYVKKILNVKKAGHSGTLDPKVTGVLPIGLNKGSKLNYLMLKAGKEYVGVLHLHDNVSDEKLQEAFNHFTGKIKQLPPVKSAVRRRWRERTVYYFDILEREGKKVLFVAGVEAGTYIRKLCHDIGEYLKVGAHMGDLRRTKAGSFNEKNSVILQDLREAYTIYKNENDDSILKKFLSQPEEAVKHVKKIYVSDSSVNSITHGSYLAIPGVVKFDSDIKRHDIVAMMTLKNEIIGYGKSLMDAKDIKRRTKGAVIVTDSIIMPQNLYPKRI